MAKSSGQDARQRKKMTKTPSSSSVGSNSRVAGSSGTNVGTAGVQQQQQSSSQPSLRRESSAIEMNGERVVRTKKSSSANSNSNVTSVTNQSNIRSSTDRVPTTTSSRSQQSPQRQQVQQHKQQQQQQLQQQHKQQQQEEELHHHQQQLLVQRQRMLQEKQRQQLLQQQQQQEAAAQLQHEHEQKLVKERARMDISALASKIQYVMNEGTISEKPGAATSSAVGNLLEGMEDILNEEDIDGRTMEIMLRLMAKHQKSQKKAASSKKPESTTKSEPLTVQQMFMQLEDESTEDEFERPPLRRAASSSKSLIPMQQQLPPHPQQRIRQVHSSDQQAPLRRRQSAMDIDSTMIPKPSRRGVIASAAEIPQPTQTPSPLLDSSSQTTIVTASTPPPLLTSSLSQYKDNHSQQQSSQQHSQGLNKEKNYTETQEIVLFKKYEALLSSRSPSEAALKTNSRLLRQMILNYGLPMNAFSDSPIVDGRPLLHLLDVLDDIDRRELNACIDRHSKNVGHSVPSSPTPHSYGGDNVPSNQASPSKNKSKHGQSRQADSSASSVGTDSTRLNVDNLLADAFDNDNPFREETPMGTVQLNYHNFSFVGVKGDCSLRGRVWKALLGVYRVSASEYTHLVAKGPSSVYSKIKNDTFRTLATNKKFKARVTDDMLSRVLNAFVWKMEKASRAPPDPRNQLTKALPKLNYTYVQGMNVLLAPFLYAMPEVDAFYAFTTFIRQCCPLYVQPTLEGVHSGLQLLDRCLEVCDPELFNYLTKTKKLSASIYAFPSVMTFCCCTPPLNEVLYLWDFLLAFGVHMNILCIVAQLIHMREQLFARQSPMKLLRVFPPLNARKVIALAMQLTAALPDQLYAQLVRHPFDASKPYTM